MRPTINVPKGKIDDNGIAIDANTPTMNRDEWRTEEVWLHWDLNPWLWTGTKEGEDYSFDGFISENNGSRNTGQRKLQGLIAITESREEDGGFCTVPGFHKYLKDWSERTFPSDYCASNIKRMPFVHVPDNDPMIKQLQKITARAGSLVVWSSEQPHCNFPNRSNRFRMNQYVKMFPAQEGGDGTDERKETITLMTKSVEVTPIGSKLFGLENWDKN